MADGRSQIQFRLLGPVEAETDAGPVDLGGPRRRAVLALLLLHANQVVPRERLIDAVWGDDAPDRVANALQVQIHGLRKVLGDGRIETHGSGYRVVARADELDVARFDALVQRARAEAPPAAAETLRAALALWSGSPLATLDAPFAAAEVARLEEERLAALESRLAHDLACGRHNDVVAELEGLVREHPYRERLRRQLITALYRSGRQADALTAYREAVATLRDELGLEPGPELRQLEAAILRQDASLAPEPTRPRTSLPAPARPLVGRTLEQAALVGLLRRGDVRMLTVTGPGGTGKTRLAVEVARELAGDYTDGAFFVDLAPVRAAELVVSAVARAFDASETTEEPETALAAQLAERELLLFVDNFEHVLDAAPALARLLAAAPGLDVLVTSRAALRIAAETEYPLPPLDLPGESEEIDAIGRSDAVALFVARAADADRAFAFGAQNAHDVAAICRAVDGLPLAIELAAARVSILSPRAIVERLEKPLDLLTSGPRDAPDRQRTLRTTIEWSRALLEPHVQALFARLAVFSGGFTLEAAEDVCGARLEELEALVEHSLVRAHTAGGGERRFAMLETIREYALELLQSSEESASVARAHCEHYVALAERFAPRLFFDETLLTSLEQEHGNLRAALAWSRDGDARLYVRLGVALWRFWYLRSFYREGRAHLETALAAGGVDAGTLADAAKGAAILAVEGGDVDAGRRHASRALDTYRALGDERGVLTALTVLGNAARNDGDVDDARRRFEESASIARKLGLDEDVAVAHANLGAVAVDVGDFERAREHVRQSLDVYRAVGRSEAIAIGLGTLAYAELRTGRTAAAAAAASESLALAHRLGFRDVISSSLVTLAASHVRDDPARAAELLGAAEAVSAGTEDPFEPRDRALREETTNEVRARLGEEKLNEGLESGRGRHESLVRDHAAPPERR